MTVGIEWASVELSLANPASCLLQGASTGVGRASANSMLLAADLYLTRMPCAPCEMASARGGRRGDVKNGFSAELELRRRAWDHVEEFCRRS